MSVNEEKKSKRGKNMYAFEKCVLASYSVIGNVVEEMDELFLKTAVKSHLSTAPCEETANKLIAMTERKKDLLVLKNLIKTAFGNLTEQPKKYILYKYFNRKDDEIEAIKNTRKYFRRQISAIVKFSEELSNLGLSEEEFKKTYLKFAFLADKYREFSEKHTVARALPSACYRIKSGKLI